MAKNLKSTATDIEKKFGLNYFERKKVNNMLLQAVVTEVVRRTADGAAFVTKAAVKGCLNFGEHAFYKAKLMFSKEKAPEEEEKEES